MARIALQDVVPLGFGFVSVAFLIALATIEPTVSVQHMCVGDPAKAKERAALIAECLKGDHNARECENAATNVYCLDTLHVQTGSTWIKPCQDAQGDRERAACKAAGFR